MAAGSNVITTNDQGCKETIESLCSQSELSTIFKANMDNHDCKHSDALVELFRVWYKFDVSLISALHDLLAGHPLVVKQS